VELSTKARNSESNHVMKSPKDRPCFRDIAEHLVETHGPHPQDLHARCGACGTPLHAALDIGHQSGNAPIREWC
jgi:hypothetical protein